MRRTFTVTCLLVLLLAELPAGNAQQDDDDDDGDNAAQNAMQVADQVEDQVAGPSMPVKKEEPVQTSVPAVTAPVSLANRFGHKHPALTATAVASSAKAEPTQWHPMNSEEAKALAADSENAHKASQVAQQAAHVATKVAEHSVQMTVQATTALKDAHDAINKARVDSAGLSDGQKRSLKAAEAKLKEATKKAEYGEVKNAKYTKVKADNSKLEKLKEMDKKMDSVKKNKKNKNNDDLEAMRKEIQELREELKSKEGDKSDDDEALKELQDQIEKMEKEDKKDDKETKKSHDEMKAEVERLREEIRSMEESEGKTATEEQHVEKYNVKMKPLKEEEPKEEEEQEESAEATPVEEKGIDVDTAMPYGDLEPFGREDTAQELTENSIRESDGMVDQLERAEVSEEKRAVFRALTRLRGAAITSFDGVARSQTGNIDEYNKIHKWRSSHPLHHLADEESDVSKWAFPENAD